MIRKQIGWQRGRQAHGSCLSVREGLQNLSRKHPRTQADAGHATLRRSRRTAAIAWRGRPRSARGCCRARNAGGCRRVTVRTTEARPWERTPGAENRLRCSAVSRARAAYIWPAQYAASSPRCPQRGVQRRPARARQPPQRPAASAGGREEQAWHTTDPSASGPEALPARRWGPGSRASPGRGTYV